MGTFSGGKFSSSHSTAIDAAAPLLTFLSRSDLVNKISLGFIQSVRGSRTNSHRIKIDQSELACLKITVRGGISVQEFRIYSANKIELAKHIAAAFPGKIS